MLQRPYSSAAFRCSRMANACQITPPMANTHEATLRAHHAPCHFIANRSAFGLSWFTVQKKRRLGGEPPFCSGEFSALLSELIYS